MQKFQRRRAADKSRPYRERCRETGDVRVVGPCSQKATPKCEGFLESSSLSGRQWPTYWRLLCESETRENEDGEITRTQ